MQVRQTGGEADDYDERTSRLLCRVRTKKARIAAGSCAQLAADGRLVSAHCMRNTGEKDDSGQQRDVYRKGFYTGTE